MTHVLYTLMMITMMIIITIISPIAPHIRATVVCSFVELGSSFGRLSVGKCLLHIEDQCIDQNT